MPFSEATLDFMALNRVMNSREWFHEHRDEYLSLVVEPIAELVEDMASEMWKIDPSLIIIPKVGKSISRIWRDTRRGPELPIYRDVMWITLLRAKYEGYPSFWFEFSPRCLRWGCGWYQTDPAIMDCIRGMILSHDPDWRAALAAFEAQKVFRLDDERYKRSRGGEARPALLRQTRRRAHAGFQAHRPGVRVFPQGRGTGQAQRPRQLT